MSKLNIDQKTVKELFENKKMDFLIPDYQRPYAWTESQCQTLWEDIQTFAFPGDDYNNFDSDNDEYFLGPIVTFKNAQNKVEVIDGQQRLTTLMLLLRAFYDRFENMKDENSCKTREIIEKCVWKTDELGKPNKDALKLDSEVATDKDKNELLTILKTGIISEGQKSNYAINYKFFQNKINDFLDKYPSFFVYLPTRILNNCILLPIEAESQDTALRIFSTLNDRGKPLTDSDIFKAQFYKYYSSKGTAEKERFISRWRTLEELCADAFSPSRSDVTPMDDLFLKYMYYARANKGIKLTTTMGLRKFYEQNSYELLRKEETFRDLEILANFWKDELYQNNERFSERILKKLFVLEYAPNDMWTHIVSVYFMHNKKKGKNSAGEDTYLLDEDKFYTFLNKITAFVWAYAMINRGVSALRGPLFNEMVNIVKSSSVTFSNYRFEEATMRNVLENFKFSNGRPITKSMLAWWAFTNESQPLIPLETSFEIEHIFAKNRQVKEQSLRNPDNLELLGNKSLLEKKINISASDYRFKDKVKYYIGFTTSTKQHRVGTLIKELTELATLKDFTEKDIKSRNIMIKEEFLKFLMDNDLIIKND